ncbi:MAG: two-component regulator propeller domain-containing protein [Candidatus Omnitrophota bacterium]
MSSLRYRVIIVFVIYVLWVGHESLLKALDPGRKITQYRFHVWNMESGLPDNDVLALVQTRDGYLWIGTQDGLVRFDGLSFQLYTKENVAQLKDNQIRALYEDDHGYLWIGTSSGGLTRYKDGEFMLYPVEKYKSLFKIKAIGGDRWGNLWIGSYTEGLTCLNDDKFDQFMVYTTKQGLPHNEVNAISKDGNGDLWVTTARGVVRVLRPGEFQVYERSVNPRANLLTSFYRAKEKELWIGTVGSYLFRLKHHQLSSYGTQNGILNATITCLYEDKRNNLWIGTDGGGLIRMTNGDFERLSVGFGLNSDYISCIYEDREGILWVGTLDGGLHQLRDTNFTNYTSREGLSHDYIQCINQDREETVWVGTKKGLDRLKLKKRSDMVSVERYPWNGSVVCLYHDSMGNMWGGTWGKGLYRFKDGKFSMLSQKEGLCDNRITCIGGDRHGNMWIGTQGGLSRYHPGNRKWETYTIRDGLSSNIIRFVFEDRDGWLWIGTIRGLNILKDGKISVYESGSMFRNYLFQCAYEDADGTLWFGTDNGLLRLTLPDKKNGAKPYRYTTRSGLVENGIYTILQDDQGYFWISGKNGISRVRKKELMDFSLGKMGAIHPNRYTENDGMKSRWCTVASYKSNDGNLWFPTPLGLSMIDPNRITLHNIPPALVIERFVADGDPVPIQRVFGGEGGAVASKRAFLTLRPGKKRFEFYYKALSFINPQKIKYKLILEGYDSDWVEREQLRNITYTNLSPGYYAFKVMACNGDGVWNKTGCSLSFYLRPYFYQRPAFRGLVVMSLFLLVLFFYWFRVRRLKARARELEWMVAERTQQLAEKNEELLLLSNLDPLTGIANRRRFMEYLTLEWQRQIRYAGTMALMMIDVDFFKKYNDTYGHQAGDACLKQTAEVIAAAARRPGDLAARYGGEEFVVILSDTSEEGAYRAAEEIRSEIEALHIPHSRSPMGSVTISLGVAVRVPRQGERMEELISLADRALYIAKEKGRNRVEVIAP